MSAQGLSQAWAWDGKPGSWQHRRLALCAFFFIPGVALASWVTRTPAIRDAIGASIAQMGMVLAGLSVGSMCGVLLSGRIVQWRGTRFTMLSGLSLVCLSLITLALGAWGAWGGWQPVVGLALGFFGLGMGTAEIAINLDAAALERESGQHLMHSLHGCFSLGTLVGALLGLGANAARLPVALHLGLGFLVLTGLLWAFSGRVPAGRGVLTAAGAAARAAAPAPLSVWRDPRVLMIGFIVFALALTVGAAYDWLPILLVDEHGFSAAMGSLVFVLFAAMMTAARFTGGLLLQRWGRLWVTRFSMALAAAGVACLVWGDSQALAAAGVLCWGLGAALGFPLALSAAAEGGGQMDARVKAVATIGYVALLVGPPALGFVGHALGLRGAMLLVLACVVAAFAVSRVMRQSPA